MRLGATAVAHHLAVMRILVIDADEIGVALLRRVLTPTGPAIEVAPDAASGRERALVNAYSAIVFGRMPQPEDGLALIRDIRLAGSSTPIVALSSRFSAADAIVALDTGADEVIEMPLDEALLGARLRAVMRRRDGAAMALLRVGDLELNRVSHQVTCDAVPMALTARQYALLEYVALHRGSTVLRTTLLEQVWNLQFDPGSNVVDVHVAQLRKRLRDAGSTVELRTVRGEGYALDAR